MKKPIRIGIVDDHPGVRAAVRGLLVAAKDIVVVGEADNGVEAVKLAEEKKPDILLLDVELPAMSGYEVVRLIREKGIDVKVLALSTYDDPVYILGMLENGADGYLTKDDAPALLLTAIRSIIKDQVKWISPKIASQVTQIQLDNMSFTGRELEILRYIVMGDSKEVIMHSLDINAGKLQRYLGLLMEKFNVPTFESLKDAAQAVISTARS